MKKITIALLYMVVTACGSAVAATPTLPDFSAATFIPGAAINNPYFPILNNTTQTYVATDSNGNAVDQRFELTPVGAGPTLMGVQTTTVRDRGFEDGLRVEDAFDHFAQDKAGNVWYFGEDVTDYKYDASGNLIGTDTASSWLAGVHGALPGFIMPSVPTVGQSYYQEFALKDNSADQGEITATGLTLSFGGHSYSNVVRVLETSAVESGPPEYKYYAPGIGLIRGEEGLDANLQNPELTFSLTSPVPEPTSILLLSLGLPLVFAVTRIRRKTLPPDQKNGID